jgi:hypothetical protein
MIEMSVRDKHHIERGQIANVHSWLPQALEHEEPAREVWVNDDVLIANLQEKARMAYERYTELAVGDELWLASLPRARGYS